MWEWTETVYFSSIRALRGGSWVTDEPHMQSSGQSINEPSDESDVFGFRVASPFSRADLDRDGDVDLIDFGLFQAEFTGLQ